MEIEGLRVLGSKFPWHPGQGLRANLSSSFTLLSHPCPSPQLPAGLARPLEEFFMPVSCLSIRGGTAWKVPQPWAFTSPSTFSPLSRNSQVDLWTEPKGQGGWHCCCRPEAGAGGRGSPTPEAAEGIWTSGEPLPPQSKKRKLLTLGPFRLT